jgi:hypothetical protein
MREPVIPDAVRVVIPNTVRAVIPNAVRAVIPNAVRAVIPNAVRAFIPNAMRAVIPNAVRDLLGFGGAAENRSIATLGMTAKALTVWNDMPAWSGQSSSGARGG